MRNKLPRQERTLAIRAIALGAIAIIVTGTLTACTAQRSAEAVCNVWNTEAVPLHDKYANDAAAGSGIEALVDLVSVPNDLATLMDKLAKVAPDDIEPDFEALAKAYHAAAGSGADAADPLAAIVGGIVGGLAVSGSEQRIDSYLSANCQGSPGVPK